MKSLRRVTRLIGWGTAGLALSACTQALGGFDERGAGGNTGTSSGGTATGQTAAKRVFVTRATFTGKFGSGLNAHKACQAIADSSGLGGTWRAWISLGKPLIDCAGGPWQLVDGTDVGACSDLTGGGLKHPIDLDEKGSMLQGGSVTSVWTGLTAQGTPTGNDCSGWMLAAGLGTIGNTKENGPGWTESGKQGCDQVAHLFCFED